MKLLVAITISGMLLTGCSKSVDSKSKSFSYPLALGNQWTYTSVLTWEHGDPPRIDTMGSATFTVTVDRVDTIRPGVLSYTTRAMVVGSEMPDGVPERTYLNLPEGMYLLSERNAGSSSYVLPRQVPHSPSVGSSDPPPARFPNTHRLLSAFPDPAGLTHCQGAVPADTLPLVLTYPQHNGLLWTVHDSGGAWSYRADKVIESRETVTTSAGRFDCWRIHSIYGHPWETTDHVEYVSAEGLIRGRWGFRYSTGLWVFTYDLASHTLRGSQGQ